MPFKLICITDTDTHTKSTQVTGMCINTEHSISLIKLYLHISKWSED